MTLWLVARTVRRAPRRTVLAALGIAFPVAMLAATLLYLSVAVRVMTPVALEPVQVEMRAIASSLNTDMNAVDRQLATVPHVQRVERFGAADVVVGAPGAGRVTARVFAVDPSYLRHHSWARIVHGSLARGAVLDQSLRTSPGFALANRVSIELPGKAAPLSLSLPVTGVADLRDATTWQSIPAGDVQGDVAIKPRTLVVDYPTFERSLLPALRRGLAAQGAPGFNPGLTDLPPATVEAHVSVRHSSFPSDPGRAAAWSTSLRRVLERQASGAAIVADNASEPLTLAKDDATNAKILFLLLGIPGVLVAAALGLAAQSALTEAHRREDALLRFRGATGGEIARLAAAQTAVAGVAGTVVGLVIAAAAVSALVGHSVFDAVSSGGLVFSALLALLAGALTTAVRLVQILRASRRSEVVTERRLLERGWSPLWLRAHLDLVAIGVGLAILVVTLASGGLKPTPIEGQTLSLSFYVLLAPIALWLGVSLLVVRGGLGLLRRWGSPERARPLSTWRAAAMRWLGRRPARTGVAVVLGALAVAFGSYVVTFSDTYNSARHADARAAFGSDIRLTPNADPRISPPRLGPPIAGVTPIRVVPIRAGSDRKSVLTLDLSTYRRTTTMAPRILSGRGVEALAANPTNVLVAKEIADGFSVKPGDTLPVTIFPDDEEKRRPLKLHVVGVFRSVAPTSPTTELVMSSAALPPFLLPPPSFHLVRVLPGNSPGDVAAAMRRGGFERAFSVATIADRFRADRRSLAALDLDKLARLESLGAVLIAAIGIAVLGAFLVLERRREFAILQAMGADASQILTPPAQEGIIAVLASLAIGVPVGVGLGMLAVRVLGLFFVLPPPLVTVPVGTLAAFAALIVTASAVALAGALAAVNRVQAAPVLREP
jgi:putative ABC transport system permease protein